MKFVSSIAALAVLAAAAPHDKNKAPQQSLDVKLSMVGNTKVEAVLTNTGPKAVRLLKSGTILGNSPTKKATVSSGDGEINFEGLNIFIDMDNLGDAAFQPVAAGQSVHVEFDIAEAHDLSAGGTISIHTQGRIPFAWEGQKAIAGSLPYSSNTVETVINGTLAAPALLSRRLNKNEIRAEVSGCEGDKLEAIEKAVSNCRSYAAIALHAIKSGPSERIEEYFMDSSESTRETVAGVYERVHEQCSSLNSGAPASCADLFDHCEVSGALAYTHTGKTMIYCDKFFTMPPVPRKCRKKSQATTFLHETTHLQIVNRNRDLAYGYNNLRELTHEEAIKNADTYALFASASEMDCDIPSSRLDEGAEDDE